MASGGPRPRWSAEESKRLSDLIDRFGNSERNWAIIASHMPGRTRKQCRSRWVNMRSEGSKRGNWSNKEEHFICQQHSLIGSQWSQISKQLPNRSDCSVKNRWNSTWRCKSAQKPHSIMWQYIQQLKAGLEPKQAFKVAMEAWGQHTATDVVIAGAGPSSGPGLNMDSNPGGPSEQQGPGSHAWSDGVDDTDEGEDDDEDDDEDDHSDQQVQTSRSNKHTSATKSQPNSEHMQSNQQDVNSAQAPAGNKPSGSNLSGGALPAMSGVQVPSFSGFNPQPTAPALGSTPATNPLMCMIDQHSNQPAPQGFTLPFPLTAGAAPTPGPHQLPFFTLPAGPDVQQHLGLLPPHPRLPGPSLPPLPPGSITPLMMMMALPNHALPNQQLPNQLSQGMPQLQGGSSSSHMMPHLQLTPHIGSQVQPLGLPHAGGAWFPALPNTSLSQFQALQGQPQLPAQLQQLQDQLHQQLQGQLHQQLQGQLQQQLQQQLQGQLQQQLQQQLQGQLQQLQGQPQLQGPVQPQLQGPVQPQLQGPVQPQLQGPVQPQLQGPGQQQPGEAQPGEASAPTDPTAQPGPPQEMTLVLTREQQQALLSQMLASQGIKAVLH